MAASEKLSRGNEKSLGNEPRDIGFCETPRQKTWKADVSLSHTWLGKVRKQGRGMLHNGATVPVLTGSISCKRIMRRASGLCSEFPKFSPVDGVFVLGLTVELNYQALCSIQPFASRFLRRLSWLELTPNN